MEGLDIMTTAIANNANSTSLAYWLGLARPAVASIMHEAEWEPDDRSAYCPRCGVTIAEAEMTENGCGSCRDRAALTARKGSTGAVVRLGSYSSDLRDWVLSVKYSRWSEMGLVLGRILGLRIRESGVLDDLANSLVIVPMPMPWQRRLYRGIDHARTIASGVGHELNAPVMNLLRKRNGPPQITLARSQRQRAGARGLSLRHVGAAIPGASLVRKSTVLLIDDVCTTGATIRSASRLIRILKPTSMMAAVVAVSDDPARRSPGPREHQSTAPHI